MKSILKFKKLAVRLLARNTSMEADIIRKMATYFHEDSILQNGAAQCHDAILNKSQLMYFYFNLFLSLFQGIFDLFWECNTVILTTVILLLVSFVLYKAYWSPIRYSKELTDIGFDHIPKDQHRDRRITRAIASKRIGSKMPPPFPNGWYAIAETPDLKAKGVIAVDALGQNFCLYRGKDGVARCVEAYCPHLGANMAIGGTVCGNCIECPFHAWRFDENGTLVSIPGNDPVPKGVSIRTWHTVEADGAIWIWHDAERREPLWWVKNSPQIKNWGLRGRNEFHISAHIQEVPENGADAAHLNAVHAPSVLTNLGEKFPTLNELIGRHVWSADWSKNDDHTSTLILVHDYKMWKFNLAHGEVEVTQVGPGQVHLYINSAIGPLFITLSITPLGPLLQKVIHRVFSPFYNAPLALIFVRSEGYMFERDVMVWSNKSYIHSPIYVRADKSIKGFRAWFQQFYSENSMSFRDAIQNPLEW